jgi:hypothetical protein
MAGYTINGDTSQLEVFGVRIAKAGSNATLRGLSRALGNEELFQVQVGFQQQRDPYGEPWRPKVIPDGNPILTGKRRKLRVGWYLKYVGSDAVIIGNRERYAVFTRGTGIYGPTGQPIRPKRAKVLSWKGAGGQRFAFRSVRGAPPRLMVPRSELPLTWDRALVATAREYMRARLTGG